MTSSPRLRALAIASALFLVSSGLVSLLGLPDGSVSALLGLIFVVCAGWMCDRLGPLGLASALLFTALALVTAPESVGYLVGGLGLAVISSEWVNTGQYRRLLVWSALLSAVFFTYLNVTSVASTYVVYDSGVRTDINRRVFEGADPNATALVFVCLAAVVSLVSLVDPRSSVRLPSTLVVALCGVGVAFTGSRAGTVGYLVILSLFFVRHSGAARSRLARRSIFILLGFSGFLGLMGATGQLSRFANIAEDGNDRRERLQAGIEYLTRDAGSLMVGNPLPGTHNSFLDLLLEVGLIGLVLLAICLHFIVKRTRRSQGTSVVPSSSYLVLCGAMMPAATIAALRVPIVWIAIGMACGIASSRRPVGFARQEARALAAS